VSNLFFMALRLLSFYFFTSFFLFSCSKKEPEDIVKEFHQHLISGETEDLREQCTSEGKDNLDEYDEAYPYFGKSEKKEVASVNCSEGGEKITCWCEEVKGFVVQYELEKTGGKWTIDFKNFRPEINAAKFHLLMNEQKYTAAKDYSTENGKTNISLLASMNKSSSATQRKELESVTCEERNGITGCYCKNTDGSETKYPMVKENGEWKVDYIKTSLPSLDPELITSDSLEMMSSEIETDFTEE